MKKTFCIGDICVGDDKRALVIPEIGINHEGSLLNVPSGKAGDSG